MFTFALVKQNNGAIAQLVEQRTENPCVPGSIPGGTTIDSVISQNPLKFSHFNGFSFILQYANSSRKRKAKKILAQSETLGDCVKILIFAS